MSKLQLSTAFKKNNIYNSFILTVALKYFKAKKNEKFISFISGFALLGVTLGVAALIVVMSVMNGFRIELTKNIIGLNSDIVITNNSDGGRINNYHNLVSLLESQNYIDKVIPSIAGQALISGRVSSSGALVRGFEVKDIKLKPQLFNNVFAGQFEDIDEDNSIALGRELATAIGAEVGDVVKLISPRTINSFIGVLPRSKDFIVKAIFSSQMYDYDAATVIMNLKQAQQYYGLSNQINNLEVYTSNSELANNYTSKIFFLLKGKYAVKSWMMMNAAFLSALQVERVAMFTVLSLIIIVAVFNIVSTLFMLVKDKTKDIAILRTLGASQSDIMIIFIINGFLSGLLGTILGVILGAGFACNINNIKKAIEYFADIKIFDAAIYFLYNLPSQLLISDVIMVSSISLFFSLVATLYPAYRAAKLNPVEAMRYE